MKAVAIAVLFLLSTGAYSTRNLLADALRESGQFSTQETPSQLRDLAEQVHALSDEIQRLREAQEFDRKLLETRAAGDQSHR